MKLNLVIIGLFLVAATEATKKPLSSWSEVFDFSKMFGKPIPYSLIQNILQDFIKNFEGEKIQNFGEIEIDSDNRFDNVMLERVVNKIHLDMEDSLRVIHIRNLSVPIKLLKLNGEYDFQELVLPGGLNIYGNGEFKVEVVDLKAFISLKMKYSAASGLWTVNDIKMDASLKRFLFDFENLMNGEPMGDFIHAMINQMVPVLVELLNGLVEENKNQIMQILSDIMNKIMNP